MKSWHLLEIKASDWPRPIAGIVVHVTAGFGALASLFVVGRVAAKSHQKPLDPPCHPFNKPLGRWLFKGEPTWSFWLVTHFWMQHFLVPRLARVSITLAHNPMIYAVYNPYIWVWIKVINICQPKIDGFTQTSTNFCGSRSPLPQFSCTFLLLKLLKISGVVWHRWISQFVALLTGKTRL